MWILPCPETCSFFAFYKLTIFTLRIDKRHITMIFFRFFIQKQVRIYVLLFCSEHVYMMVVQKISDLFELVKTLFGL